MDIRATDAARLYKSLRPITQPLGPAAREATQPRLETAVGDAAQSFVHTLREAETTARDAMIGRADPHALVQALAQTELAIETAVALRNRVVEAYQEILRMPV